MAKALVFIIIRLAQNIYTFNYDSRVVVKVSTIVVLVKLVIVR